jgi:hypothetical protein
MQLFLIKTIQNALSPRMVSGGADLIHKNGRVLLYDSLSDETRNKKQGEDVDILNALIILKTIAFFLHE